LKGTYDGVSCAGYRVSQDICAYFQTVDLGTF
jgi:hypothetical protein